MHYGSIDDTSNTAAARVFRYLHERKGCWVDGWTLTTGAKVSAVSTRVSEVRHQLPEALCIDVETRTRPDGTRGFYYRLNDVAGAQLELAV